MSLRPDLVGVIEEEYNAIGVWTVEEYLLLIMRRKRIANHFITAKKEREMGYKIVKQGNKYLLLEIGFEHIKLGLYDTEEAAEKSRKQWIARDDLSDKISEFYDEVKDNFGTILEEKEIIEMIKEHS